MKWVAVLSILAVVGPVWGSEPTPMDFAKGIVLECPQDASIYRFVLPEHVYEGLTRDDFGDLRVFNGDGETVPFSLKYSGDERTRTDQLPPVFLSVFPVRASRDIGRHNAGVNVRIVTDETGAVVNVNTTGEDPSNGVENPVAFYLLDVSQIEHKPDKLHFDWPRNAGDRMARIRILESRDLDHWTPLVHSAVLADFRLGDNSLKQDTVALPPFHSPYLKIEMTGNTDELILSSVTGMYNPLTVNTETSLRWTRITGAPLPDNPSGYLFTVPCHLPIERVKIRLPQPNTLIRAELLSRDQVDAPWGRVYAGLFYTLDRDGVAFENTLVTFPCRTDRYWLLNVEQGNGAPLLAMGWLPHAVLFVAQGRGPFTLAYGSGTATPPDNRMDTLLKDIHEDQAKHLIKDAVFKTAVTLGGRVKLERPKPPIPVRRIFLWGILIAGVCLCAGMAISLYRQMKTSQDRD